MGVSSALWISPSSPTTSRFPTRPWEFGPGWMAEEDQQQRLAEGRAAQQHEGRHPTEEEWLAELHSHWYYWLPPRKRLMYAFSIVRRWPWIHYAI
jgi:hypothetical protein